MKKFFCVKNVSAMCVVYFVMMVAGVCCFYGMEEGVGRDLLGFGLGATLTGMTAAITMWAANEK